jgi:outer membrane protein assembly factor BamC
MQRHCRRTSTASHSPWRAPARLAPLAGLALAAALAGGCGTVGDALSPARVDYRSEGSRTAPPLDVPPDLTQLGRDPRYQPPAGGTVTASALQTAAAAGRADGTGSSPDKATVSLRSMGDLHIERSGSQRWLATQATPEQLWPQVREFWTENGFTLEIDQPELGIMETAWAENRAKLPQDFVRRTIGRFLENMYDSGERDRYRTRLERSDNGTEIYISHRGLTEVAIGAGDSTNTRWQPRSSDVELEAEMLAKLMARLAGKNAQPAAGAVTAAAGAASAPADAVPPLPVPDTPARARVVQDKGTAALQVDDGFDRAWRRVGLALDRSGFTVEDRDRNAGTYYVRYVDPKFAGKEEPGFFDRLMGAKPQTGGADRYRVVVKAEGAASIVSVLDSVGDPQNGESAQRIVELLVADLK